MEHRRRSASSSATAATRRRSRTTTRAAGSGPSATSSRARSTATRSSRSTTRRRSTTRSRGSRARCSACLPNLPAEFPQSSAGVSSWDTMPTRATFAFSGYIGHYHLTNQKWDPGPFDFKEFCRKLRGAFCFPVFPKGDAEEADEKPIVPDDSPTSSRPTIERALQGERSARRRRVLPRRSVGRSAAVARRRSPRPAKEDAPVFAPFPGRLVAARMGTSSPIGSMNFVLHAPRHGARQVARCSSTRCTCTSPTSCKADKPAEWMAKSERGRSGKPGEVVLLDEPIEAGALIGHVGKAGPAELIKRADPRRVLLDSELFTDVPARRGRSSTAPPAAGSATSPQINDAIDNDKDGTLSQAGAVARSTRAAAAAQLHYLVTLPRLGVDRRAELGRCAARPEGLQEVKPAEIDAARRRADHAGPVVGRARRGALPAAARRRRLPLSPGHVPRLVQPAAARRGGAGRPAPVGRRRTKRKEVPKGITDDFGDKDGTSMRSSADIAEDPCNEKLDAAGARAGLRRAGVRAVKHAEPRRPCGPSRRGGRSSRCSARRAAALALLGRHGHAAPREAAPSAPARRTCRCGSATI